MIRALLLAALGACSFEPGVLAVSIDAADAPEPDTDGDALVDRLDNCPTVANADQRDWDGDTHGDACDGCPHLASMLDPDDDRDGVGDACDPRPNAAGDRRVIWIAFDAATDIDGWVNTGGTGQWTVENNKLRQSASTFALLDSPLQYGDLYFATRIEIVATTNEIGFCSGNVPIGMQYYCCGVYVNGGSYARAVSNYTGVASPPADVASFPSAAAGDTIEVVGTMTPTASRCTITKAGTFVMLETPRGAPRTGTAVFYTQAPALYHYAFVAAIGS